MEEDDEPGQDGLASPVDAQSPGWSLVVGNDQMQVDEVVALAADEAGDQEFLASGDWDIATRMQEYPADADPAQASQEWELDFWAGDVRPVDRWRPERE
jgi:hypothetical protein